LTLIHDQTPGRQLLNEVTGLFRQQGTTLAEWAEQNGLRKQNARAYLLGERDGEKAREWRAKILTAARKETLEQ
jgi:hypothetical protein